MYMHLKKILCAVLILLLALSACAEGRFSAYVTNERANVFSDRGLSDLIGSLSHYDIVMVEEYKNGAALITYRGRRGYMGVTDLAPISSVGQAATLKKGTKVYTSASKKAKYTTMKVETDVYILKTTGSWCMVEKDANVGYVLKDSFVTAKAEPEVVWEDFQAQVIVQTLPVYKSASTGSKRLGVMKYGDILNVQAYSGDWARVEKSGNIGFCRISGLTRYVDPYAYMKNPDKSNKDIIFEFLKKEMNLNTAAAVGVLANIKYESGFRVEAVGDAGKSIGICQWYYLRKTRLETFCANREYDSQTLYGQLWYLKYELEKYYPKVLNVLKKVPNTADGAYTAAHSFCYDFEGPANRESKSVTRAKYAKNTLWSQYAGS